MSEVMVEGSRRAARVVAQAARGRGEGSVQPAEIRQRWSGTGIHQSNQWEIPVFVNEGKWPDCWAGHNR